ncbi:hypothetical protein [Alteromonas sp. CYL-A6]|uniref:hypothetical protein n=1 Tax=Alteromonas nitratireducens TaxID=3390813 RepID=UPI0034B7375E
MTFTDSKPTQKLLLNGRALMTSEDGLEEVFNKLRGDTFAGNGFLYETYLIMMAQALRVNGWDGELTFVDQDGRRHHHLFNWSDTAPAQQAVG